MADNLQASLVSLAKVSAHPSNIGRALGDLRSLTESIREKGVLVPIVVERHGDRYRLRDGHRRLAAAKIAGRAHAPALIHTEALDEADWLLESIGYNERRKGYSPKDKRRVAVRLIELGVGKGAIAEAFGMSWAKVAQLIQPRQQSTPLEQARREVARSSTVISRKALHEFIDHCDALGYRGADVLVMLRALLDGRDWHTVDAAYATEEGTTDAV